ncbi:MAG: hypothetical protein HFJ04_06405 [Lachnospiraceae bacterium]|nr:hypothetical protein [Lachnospiraceae bacterium]
MKKYIRLLPALILALTVGFVSHSLMKVEAEEEMTIPYTVYIGDIDVSGMTAKEAEEALDAYVRTIRNTSFTLTTGDKSIHVSAEDLGLGVEGADVIEEALHLGRSGNLISRYKDKKDLEKEPKRYDITFSADESRIQSLLGANMENLNQEAVNCGLERVNGAFNIIDGANGIEVNTAESVQAIQDYIRQEWDGTSAVISLVTDVTEPQGTKESLSKVKDVLGAFHTDFSSSAAGRAKNVQRGAELINGSLLYPGEQFSVYEAVAPMDAENGYELAGSYENGTTVQTYGGGICQVSTTLYNAVILSELQIDERYNHSMIVTYVKPSMDAAIAGTVKDLKFSNNTDAPIYIEGYTSGGQLYFTIYGEETRPSNRVVSYESETISQTNPGVSLQADGSHGIGYFATLSTPHTGYTARLWKVVTVDGKEESRTEFNSSQYRATNKVLAVGTATDNPEAAAQMAAAIATGNEGTVRSTVAALQGDPAAQAAQQAAADAAAAQAAAEAAAAQAAAEQAAAEQAAAEQGLGELQAPEDVGDE